MVPKKPEKGGREKNATKRVPKNKKKFPPK
jgi:hypothetical protein